MTRPDRHIYFPFLSLSLQRAIRLFQDLQGRPAPDPPHVHREGPRLARLVKPVDQKQGLGEQEAKEVDEDGHAQPVPESLPAHGREAVEVVDEERGGDGGGEEGPEEVGVLWVGGKGGSVIDSCMSVFK